MLGENGVGPLDEEGDFEIVAGGFDRDSLDGGDAEEGGFDGGRMGEEIDPREGEEVGVFRDDGALEEGREGGLWCC